MFLCCLRSIALIADVVFVANHFKRPNINRLETVVNFLLSLFVSVDFQPSCVFHLHSLSALLPKEGAM
jgi:hypothetical protein